MKKTNLILAMTTLMLCGQASADNVKQYHIPAQSLSNVLLKFSADSGVKTLFAVEEMRGLNSNALEGLMTSVQALTRLLQGSGMTYRFGDTNNIVAIESPTSNFRKVATIKKSQAPQTSSEDVTLPIITVEAGARNLYNDPNWATDPYNTDYTRPNSTTATKTDTPIFDTPVSVQIVPKQVIQDQQAINMQDALNNVSGVFADHGSQGGSFSEDSFLIRGFPTQKVGFSTAYRDGYLSLLGGRFSLANVEQIEVLKGPAAFLYGRLEPGGLINIVSKRPQTLPYYSLQQQFSS